MQNEHKYAELRLSACKASPLHLLPFNEFLAMIPGPLPHLLATIFCLPLSLRHHAARYQPAIGALAGRGPLTLYNTL
jgi:hypothetical protein